MRHAGDTRHGHRVNALIVVLWRAGLRIQEALSLTETDLDQRRGSILVRHGKNDRRREVGMDAWAWTGASGHGLPTAWSFRSGRCSPIDAEPSAGAVGQRGAVRASPPRAPGRSPTTVGAAPAPPCARRRAAARRNPAAADPAPTRPLTSVNDRHLPPRDRHRRDHLDGPRAARTDDARWRRPRSVAKPRERTRAPAPPLLATETAAVHERWLSIEAEALAINRANRGPA